MQARVVSNVFEVRWAIIAITLTPIRHKRHNAISDLSSTI